MNAIVNVSPQWGIGANGKLLVHVPADLRRFHDLTVHQTIIYGRKTLATFPEGKPLADRENIILSKHKDFTVEGATVCHGWEELRELLKQHYSEQLWVCGGESVYKLLVPYCEKAYVTFSYTDLKADKVFPNLNRNENWIVTDIQPTVIEGRVPYRFVEYTNTKPQAL